jgi:hypothetical protein
MSRFVKKEEPCSYGTNLNLELPSKCTEYLNLHAQNFLGIKMYTLFSSENFPTLQFETAKRSAHLKEIFVVTCNNHTQTQQQKI